MKNTKSERFIIKVIGDVSLSLALECIGSVADQGKISETAGVKHHCHITAFTNGIKVHCVKRWKSERFIVWRSEE